MWISSWTIMNSKQSVGFLIYVVWDSGGLGSTDIYDLNSKSNRTILGPLGGKRPIHALKGKLRELSPV